MDPVFQQSLDEVINEDLRMKASEATKGSRPVDNIEQAPAPVEAKAGESWWDYSRSFIEGAGEVAYRFSPPGVLQSGFETSRDMLEQGRDYSGARSDPIGTAVATGALKAAYETADFVQEVAGVDTDSQKPSPVRKYIEDQSAEAAKVSKPAAVVAPIAQFVAGILGAGKLLGPIKAANMGVKAKGAFLAAESAMASSMAFDGHEERLSNLVQEFPALENPVSAYLAASPDDTEMEGRMKAALEDLGLGAMAGGFLASLRVLKLGRMGDTEAASALAQQLADDSSMEGIMAQLNDSGRVTGPVQDTGVRLTEGKPKVRVKAGSERVGMTGTEANPGKAADDAAGGGPTVTIEQNLDPNLRADPKLKQPAVPEVITVQEIEDIVRGAEFDTLRVDQTYGDRAEAVLQSNNGLAPRRGIPWQKVRGPQDMEDLIANMAKVKRSWLDETKGGAVLKDASVNTAVRNMVRWANVDRDLVVADLIKAGNEAPLLIKRMDTAFTLSRAGFAEVVRVKSDYKFGNYAPYGGTEEATFEYLQKRMNESVSLFGAAQSMMSNAGRATRFMRFAVNASALKMANKLTPEEYIKLLDTAGDDLSKLKEVATPSVMRRFMEQVQFSQRNGLLWFYPTHIVNVTGNVLMQVLRPTEKLIGSAVQSAWKPGVARDIRDAALKEYTYMGTSLLDGLKAGLEAGLKGDSRLAPHTSDLFGGEADLFATKHVDLTNIQWSKVDSFAGMAANAYKAYNILSGVPTRALGAQDEFFTMVAYRGFVQSKAWVEGTKLRLSGQDLKDFVADRLKGAFDSEGRAVDPEALREARTRTFNQELLPGTLGFAIRNMRASYPALGFVLPFVKTPINVLRYAHKYTPILNMAQKEYRQAFFGKLGSEMQAHAIGQMALGSMFVSAAAYMASSGMITGGGPRDPQLKAQMLQDGWKPYAVKVEIGGKTEFIPYGRLDPVGMPLGIAADMWEIYTADPDNEELQNAATATAIALAKNFSERTFLLNVNMLMDAMADPEANMGKFMGGTLRSTVPFGSAMKGYVNQDPYLRDARTLMDRMMQDVPGYSVTIPPKRHAVLGYPLLKNLGLTSSRKHRPVEDELMRLALETDNGIYPPDPVRNSVDLRELRLKDNRTAYDILQENVGNENGELNRGSTRLPPLRKALEDLMKSKEYQAMEDGGPGIAATKLNAISGVVQNYREAAFGALMLDYPEVKQKVLMRDVQAKGEFLMNMGKPGAAQSLLNSIGVPSK